MIQQREFLIRRVYFAVCKISGIPRRSVRTFKQSAPLSAVRSECRRLFEIRSRLIYRFTRHITDGSRGFRRGNGLTSDEIVIRGEYRAEIPTVEVILVRVILLVIHQYVDNRLEYGVNSKVYRFFPSRNKTLHLLFVYGDSLRKIIVGRQKTFKVPEQVISVYVPSDELICAFGFARRNFERSAVTYNARRASFAYRAFAVQYVGYRAGSKRNARSRNSGGRSALFVSVGKINSVRNVIHAIKFDFEFRVAAYPEFKRVLFRGNAFGVHYVAYGRGKQSQVVASGKTVKALFLSYLVFGKDVPFKRVRGFENPISLLPACRRYRLSDFKTIERVIGGRHDFYRKFFARHGIRVAYGVARARSRGHRIITYASAVGGRNRSYGLLRRRNSSAHVDIRVIIRSRVDYPFSAPRFAERAYALVGERLLRGNAQILVVKSYYRIYSLVSVRNDKFQIVADVYGIFIRFDDDFSDDGVHIADRVRRRGNSASEFAFRGIRRNSDVRGVSPRGFDIFIRIGNSQRYRSLLLEVESEFSVAEFFSAQIPYVDYHRVSSARNGIRYVPCSARYTAILGHAAHRGFFVNSVKREPGFRFGFYSYRREILETFAEYARACKIDFILVSRSRRYDHLNRTCGRVFVKPYRFQRRTRRSYLAVIYARINFLRITDNRSIEYEVNVRFIFGNVGVYEVGSYKPQHIEIAYYRSRTHKSGPVRFQSKVSAFRSEIYFRRRIGNAVSLEERGFNRRNSEMRYGRRAVYRELLSVGNAVSAVDGLIIHNVSVYDYPYVVSNRREIHSNRQVVDFYPRIVRPRYKFAVYPYLYRITVCYRGSAHVFDYGIFFRNAFCHQFVKGESVNREFGQHIPFGRRERVQHKSVMLRRHNLGYRSLHEPSVALQNAVYDNLFVIPVSDSHADRGVVARSRSVARRSRTVYRRIYSVFLDFEIKRNLYGGFEIMLRRGHIGRVEGKRSFVAASRL